MNNFNVYGKRKRLVSKKRCEIPLKKWKVTPIVPVVETVVDNRDLIQRLNGHTSHIVERIFGYLDYSTVLKAEKVSPEWEEILKNERIWKALLKRNVAVDPVWRTLFNQAKDPEVVAHAGEDFYMTRKTCVQIGNLYQQLTVLMSSSVSLLSSSVKLIAKVLTMLRIVGFPVPYSDSDDSDED